MGNIVSLDKIRKRKKRERALMVLPDLRMPSEDTRTRDAFVATIALALMVALVFGLTIAGVLHPIVGGAILLLLILGLIIALYRLIWAITFPAFKSLEWSFRDPPPKWERWT